MITKSMIARNERRRLGCIQQQDWIYEGTKWKECEESKKASPYTLAAESLHDISPRF